MGVSLSITNKNYKGFKQQNSYFNSELQEILYMRKIRKNRSLSNPNTNNNIGFSSNAAKRREGANEARRPEGSIAEERKSEATI